MAQSYGANITSAEGFAQAVELMSANRVDATINDKLSFLDYKKKHPNAPIKIADEKSDGAASGFMFRKDSGKLVDKVNKALKDMKKTEHTQKFLRNGLAKMFLLNNIFPDGERLNQLISIAQSSLLPMLKGAIQYSIPLTLISFAIGIVLAVLTALARLSSSKILNIIARVYVSIIRGTPLLVQLFIIFYGLPNLDITIDPFISAVIGFSLSVGAYASEIIRAAIQSIPKGQWEAGYSLGMTYSQALRRIILPQAARVSIPPLSNSFISLIKDTSLASLILVSEMFRQAQEIASTNYEFLLLYSEAALLYWVMCTILSIIQGRIEIRLDRYVSK